MEIPVMDPKFGEFTNTTPFVEVHDLALQEFQMALPVHTRKDNIPNRAPSNPKWEPSNSMILTADLHTPGHCTCYQHRGWVMHQVKSLVLGSSAGS